MDPVCRGDKCVRLWASSIVVGAGLWASSTAVGTVRWAAGVQKVLKRVYVNRMHSH